MEWLSLLAPLLQIGSGLLGTAIGNQDNKQEATNTNSVTGQTQSDMTDAITKLLSTVTNSQTTNQNTNENTTGSTSQTGNDTSKVAGTSGQVQTNTGNTSRLDAATTSLLTKQVQSLMAQSKTGSTDVLNQLNSLNSPANAFNANTYVSGIMKAATANARSGQESDLNSIYAGTGGNGGTNSAAALLANKERDSTAATLSGIQAQATGDAQNILAQRASTTEGLSGALQSNVSGLLQLLEGAGETTTGSAVAKGTTGQTTIDNSKSAQTTAQKVAQTTAQKTASTQKTNQTQDTNQKTSSVAAGNTSTVASGTSNDQTHNWEDFFNQIAKGFGANFHVPT